MVKSDLNKSYSINELNSTISSMDSCCFAFCNDKDHEYMERRLVVLRKKSNKLFKYFTRKISKNNIINVIRRLSYEN